MVRTDKIIKSFGARVLHPLDPISVTDAYNTYAEAMYIGGLFVWLEDGTGLRTLYVVDNVFAWVRSWDHLEVWLAFTALHNIDDFFLEEDVEIGGEYNAYRIESIPELRDLIKTSKSEVYHLTNLEWQCLVGWKLLTFEDQYRNCIHDCTAEEMLEAMLDVEYIATLTGYVVDGQKTDQELQEYIDKTNINKKIWYVDVDVRTNVNVLYRLSKKPEYN